MIVSAAVGVVGLEATYAAVKAGKQVALSNARSTGGGGRNRYGRGARQANVELLPVDSEHNAIHQCLRGGLARRIEAVGHHCVRRAFRKDAAGRDG